MNNLLIRLEQWLKSNRPSFLSQLRPRASPLEIATFEASLGMQLPGFLQQLYEWHNGQLPHGSGFQFACRLVGSNESLGIWKELNDINTDVLKDDPASIWWSSSWIPLLDDGSDDLLCVDARGLFDSSPSQIISFQHDDCARIIEFPSIEHWLATFVETLELGMWQESDGRLEPIDRADYDTFRKARNPGFPRVVMT